MRQICKAAVHTDGGSQAPRQIARHAPETLFRILVDERRRIMDTNFSFRQPTANATSIDSA